MNEVMTIRLYGEAFILDAPTTLLAGKSRCQVRLTINGLSCRTQARLLQNRDAVIIVPPTLLNKLNLKVGQSVLVEIHECDSEGREQLPADLSTALDEAGCNIFLLPAFERQQLISLIKEATEPVIRRKRMEAIISVCREKGLVSTQEEYQ